MYFKGYRRFGKVSRVKNLTKREENLYQLLDAVANRYGCLPSELLQKADTFDLEIYLTISNLEDRERKIKKGESITDNYDQENLKELYESVTGKKPVNNKQA
tara:strand:+ start:315 stop:620 length:306 start_codon:yes stop_codon:yes gene_type:complete